MIFYQATLPEVSLELIEECLIKRIPVEKTVYFDFIDHPDTNSLNEYLNTVDNKRKTLKNPYKHSFIYLELKSIINYSLDELITINKKVADAINIAFENDLFICSYIYQDTYRTLHSLIIISDIERSLPDASLRRLRYEDLHKFIHDSLLNYQICDLVQSALYLFSNKKGTIAYDGVISLQCNVSAK